MKPQASRLAIAAIAFTRVSPEAHGLAVDEIAPESNDVIPIRLVIKFAAELIGIFPLPFGILPRGEGAA